MGRLAGHSQWMQENEGFNDDRLHVDARPTKLSDPMIEIDVQGTGLSQNLKYWTRWPPFHPRFGGFEMGQFNLSEEDLVLCEEMVEERFGWFEVGQFNLSGEDLILCEDMDEVRIIVDISSIDNTENEKFRKIEGILILIAETFKNHVSSDVEGRVMEDHEQATSEENEIQPAN